MTCGTVAERAVRDVGDWRCTNSKAIHKLEKMNKLLMSALTAVLLFGSTAGAWADSFPATVTFRKAVTGPGYVLVINTTLKQDVPAILTVFSTALATENTYKINLTWRKSTQLGYREGITVYPGDKITLANAYYDVLHVELPR